MPTISSCALPLSLVAATHLPCFHCQAMGAWQMGAHVGFLTVSCLSLLLRVAGDLQVEEIRPDPDSFILAALAMWL